MMQSKAVAEVMAALCAVTQSLPIGTNLALLHFLWMLLSGQLLHSRGALFPALQGIGLSKGAMRRAWAAFRGGAWQIAQLLNIWQQYVTVQPYWEALSYAGYTVKAVDITAYWRPTMKDCASKHYHPRAGKALQAVEMGLIGRVGQVGAQRVTLLTEIVRGEMNSASPKPLVNALLKRVAATMADNELVVLDAGFKVGAVQAAKIPRFVLRGPKNFTARRNTLPPYKGCGRKPEYGVKVRPLARKRKKRVIDATPSDHVETWQVDGRTLRAEFWFDLVTTNTKVNEENVLFHVVVIRDPKYKTPWLLICSHKLSGIIAWRLYKARWPIEQVPLVAKQTLGGARQFVSNPESCHRLPELTLFASTILTYLAATLPPVPTGFWDRNPKPTAGRLRRMLTRLPFPDSFPLPGRFREKKSVTDHLPKGILGHRRQKQAKVA